MKAVGSSASAVWPLATRLVLARTETTSEVNLPESDANSRPVPGAVREGATTAPAPVWDFGIPREEKPASPPSLVPAATPITHGAVAYGFMVSLPGPEFPAANTTTILLSCACLLAIVIGSFKSKAPWVPHELEITRM